MRSQPGQRPGWQPVRDRQRPAIAHIAGNLLLSASLHRPPPVFPVRATAQAPRTAQVPLPSPRPLPPPLLDGRVEWPPAAGNDVEVRLLTADAL